MHSSHTLFILCTICCCDINEHKRITDKSTFECFTWKTKTRGRKRGLCLRDKTSNGVSHLGWHSDSIPLNMALFLSPSHPTSIAFRLRATEKLREKEREKANENSVRSKYEDG